MCTKNKNFEFLLSSFIIKLHFSGWDRETNCFLQHTIKSLISNFIFVHSRIFFWLFSLKMKKQTKKYGFSTNFISFPVPNWVFLSTFEHEIKIGSNERCFLFFRGFYNNVFRFTWHFSSFVSSLWLFSAILLAFFTVKEKKNSNFANEMILKVSLDGVKIIIVQADEKFDKSFSKKYFYFPFQHSVISLMIHTKKTLPFSYFYFSNKLNLFAACWSHSTLINNSILL